MKSLLEYINESTQSSTASTSKVISLNFKSLTNSEETIKQLLELCDDNNINYVQSDEKIDITITKTNNDNGEIENVYNFLNDYATNLRKETQNASNESYAQKTHSFKDKVDSIQAFMDELEEVSDETKNNEEKSDTNKNDEE